jgi:regulator of replication initiation timing
MSDIQYYLGKEPLFTKDDVAREVESRTLQLRTTIEALAHELARLKETNDTLLAENQRLLRKLLKAIADRDAAREALSEADNVFNVLGDMLSE